MANFIPNLEIENANIMRGTFRNFRGERDRYNKNGVKNFCVLIEDPQLAEQLLEDGWNIRALAPRDPEDDPKHYLNVAINFDFWRQPKVFLISNGVKTQLDDETIGILDGTDIAYADIVIRPRRWEDDGEWKIKAYLDELYVTVEMSKFASKYAEEECPEEPPFR